PDIERGVLAEILHPAVVARRDDALGYLAPAGGRFRRAEVVLGLVGARGNTAARIGLIQVDLAPPVALQGIGPSGGFARLRVIRADQGVDVAERGQPPGVEEGRAGGLFLLMPAILAERQVPAMRLDGRGRHAAERFDLTLLLGQRHVVLVPALPPGTEEPA